MQRYSFLSSLHLIFFSSFSVNMFHDQFLWPDPLPMVSLPPLKVLGQTGRELDDLTSGSIIGSIARIGRPMGNITTNIGANIGRTGQDIQLNFEIGLSSYGRMTADDVRRQLFDIFGDVKGQIRLEKIPLPSFSF